MKQKVFVVFVFNRRFVKNEREKEKEKGKRHVLEKLLFLLEGERIICTYVD